MKQRIALLVYVDLDPVVPGVFDTADLARDKVDGHLQDLARNRVADHLERKIDLYNPIVAHAPDSLQPPNHPRNMEDSGEIPRVIVVNREQPMIGSGLVDDTERVTVEFQTTPLDDRTYYDD